MTDTKLLMDRTPAGRLLDRALDLDFITENFSVPWDEVTMEESVALRILRNERDKYLREQQEKRQREQEQAQAMAEMQHRRR